MRDQEVHDLRNFGARAFERARPDCAIGVRLPQGFNARGAHLGLELQPAVANLAAQCLRSNRHARSAAQQVQRLIAFRPDIPGKSLVSLRYGFDAGDQGGRGIARTRRLQPLRCLGVVGGEAIEVGVEGLRCRA